MQPLRGGGRCFAHAKGAAAARTAARRKGGKNAPRRRTRATVSVATIKDLQTHLAGALADTLMLHSTIHRARTIRTIVAEGRQLLETGEYDKRLEEILAYVEAQR